MKIKPQAKIDKFAFKNSNIIIENTGKYQILKNYAILINYKSFFQEKRSHTT